MIRTIYYLLVAAFSVACGITVAVAGSLAVFWLTAAIEGWGLPIDGSAVAFSALFVVVPVGFVLGTAAGVLAWLKLSNVR